MSCPFQSVTELIFEALLGINSEHHETGYTRKHTLSVYSKKICSLLLSATKERAICEREC
jgi:hypothetical protein